MMISLYSQDKESVTIFETLKLFTQYILHPHIYSISPYVRVSMDLYAMPRHIYFFSSIMGDEEEREKKEYRVVHFNIQG